jgi:hypothetical protein
MHQTTLFDKDIVSQKKLNVSNLVIGAPSWHVSSSSNDICSTAALRWQVLSRPFNNSQLAQASQRTIY